MSLNQLTQNSEKQWLIAKTFDLTIDGNLVVTNPNSRPGDILQCTEDGIAEFAPPHVVPNLGIDYFEISSNGNQTATGNYIFTVAPTWTLANFTTTTSNTLTCNTTGYYLCLKKVTCRAPSSGGVRSSTFVNNVENASSILAVQGTGGSPGTGLATGYLLLLFAGDTIQEQFIPFGTAFQTTTVPASSTMQFIKIG